MSDFKEILKFFFFLKFRFIKQIIKQVVVKSYWMTAYIISKNKSKHYYYYFLNHNKSSVGFTP